MMMIDELKGNKSYFNVKKKIDSSDLIYNFIDTVYALQDLKHQSSSCSTTRKKADITTEFLLKMVSEYENR